VRHLGSGAADAWGQCVPAAPLRRGRPASGSTAFILTVLKQHTAFAASSRAEVDAFYAAGMRFVGNR
jgi:hypothetical protein